MKTKPKVSVLKELDSLVEARERVLDKNNHVDGLGAQAFFERARKLPALRDRVREIIERLEHMGPPKGGSINPTSAAMDTVVVKVLALLRGEE